MCPPFAYELNLSLDHLENLFSSPETEQAVRRFKRSWVGLEGRERGSGGWRRLGGTSVGVERGAHAVGTAAEAIEGCGSVPTLALGECLRYYGRARVATFAPLSRPTTRDPAGERWAAPSLGAIGAAH